MTAILLAAVAAAAALSILELRRLNRRLLPLRLAAVITAVAALAALALPPVRTLRTAGDRAVLVTDGASAGDGARIADSVGARKVLLALDSLSTTTRELFIVGWGLDSFDLPRLDGVAAHLLPSPMPHGVTQVTWPERTTLGEEVLISGRASPAGRWVHSGGAAVTADSVRPSADGQFSLRVRPRVEGLAQLTLRSGAMTDTLSIDVGPPRLPRLLVIEAAPSFETSRLRDWTSRRGGAVAIRRRVSAGRWRTERVNAGAGAIGALSPELLRVFDVLLIDAVSLTGLSSVERSALRNAVESDGVGILVLPGSSRMVPGPGNEPAFSLTGFGGDARAVRVQSAGSVRTEPPVPVAPTFLRDTFGIATLIRDERGRAVAQWRPVGAGRVATTLVRAPSRWLLEGERGAYDRYWSQLLGAVARPVPRWSLHGTRVLRPGEPMVIAREGALMERAVVLGPEGSADTIRLELDQPGVRSWGRYWPRSPGLHVVAADGDSARFHVGGPSSWTAARAAARIEATRRWIDLRAAPGRRPDISATEVPLPAWWFFALFLSAAGWLWWERRSA